MFQRKIRFWFFMAFLLVGCANVSGQLQVLSPTEATAVFQQTMLATQASHTISPAETTIASQPVSSPTPQASEGIKRIPSPDTRWTALLDPMAGSLEVENVQGEKQSLLPLGSMVNDVMWSADSTKLMVAVSNLSIDAETSGSTKPPEIMLASLVGDSFSAAGVVYQAPPDQAPGQILLGVWSLDNQRILFWMGPASSSLQADGLPLWILDIETGIAIPLSQSTLVNRAYLSWSPDSKSVVFTDGGYRSAQVGKSLAIYDVSTGQITTVVPSEDLVPGQVSWSPDGNTIALAAVEASLTGQDYADWMGWDNPAILARRIYLLNVPTKQYARLNEVEAYQDAPQWSKDGKILFYIQSDGLQAEIMSADPANGMAQALPNCHMALPEVAGYYGQVDWTALYAACPVTVP